MSVGVTQQKRLMHRYSTLAGPFTRLPKGKPYTVRYTSANSQDSLFYRVWARVVAYGSLSIVLLFAYILFQPSHWIVFRQPDSRLRPENWLMLVCLGLLQVFIIIGTYSATRSTVKAKTPLPVRHPRNLRVAFATTRAPGEPISMVQNTLQAIKRVRHSNVLMDVWLLDETNDVELKSFCRNIDVKYFSRAGKPSWNQTPPHQERFRKLKKLDDRIIQFFSLGILRPATASKVKKYNPSYAAKTKHGNFNAWLRHLAIRGNEYDILAGVDTDHVPEPNYLERMLGYFRDPNVAYVVGPQVYGNYHGGLRGLVVRWAESQASFFQSTIQRAGNATNSSMFVGTNYTVRMKVLEQIHGFQPCITEDMATGLAIHAARNPASGERWKSVYTPDVLAVGEGPEFWAPYFTQQWRWAGGSFDTWRRQVGKVVFKLPPRVMLHYFLMLTFYPITALTWLVGIISSVTYLLTGATGIFAPWKQFISLFLVSIVLQLSLYFWNRRINVSPFDKQGTYGIPGMILTSATSVIYLSALVGIALGKKPNFVVTKKGGEEAAEKLSTFKVHFYWVALLLFALVVAIMKGHTHPAMMVWVALQAMTCLLPIGLAFATALAQGAFGLAPSKSLGRSGVTHG